MISHYQQLKTLLEAEAPCFIGDPEEDTNPPYCFIWGIKATRNALTVSGEIDSLDEWFKVSCVAETGSDAVALAEGIINRLATATLTVPGWRTFPIMEHEIGLNGPLSQYGGTTENTNHYPNLVVLDVRLQATKG